MASNDVAQATKLLSTPNAGGILALHFLLMHTNDLAFIKQVISAYPAALVTPGKGGDVIISRSGFWVGE